MKKAPWWSRKTTAARKTRAGLAALLVTGLIAGGLASGIVPGDIAPAEAAAGTPGVPSAPVVLYNEDFENAPGQNLSIRDYVSASGQTYTASNFWANRSECNGFVTSVATATNSTDCTVADQGNASRRLAFQNTVRQMVSAISVLNGQPAATNSGLAELANSRAPSGEAVFQTVSQIPLPAANRFIAFSVNAAATTCGRAQANLVFYAVNDEGVEIPLNTTPMNPCTQGTVIGSTTSINTGAIYGATLFPQQSVLLEGTSLGVILRNSTNSTDGNGNDFAIDDIRILDVSPQLDKSFSPARVPAGDISTLTLTVTNTSELAAKDGWAFTDTLPDGLTLANPVNTGGTCDADVDATAGGDSIEITNGALDSGEVSCTITVDVTAGNSTGSNPDSVTFANCASNISGQVGINDPDCAEVEFYSVPALEISKTSDATAQTKIGDTVTYTVTATNTGSGNYTSANPALVVDDLTDVLDDADYENDVTATRTGDLDYTDPRISWEGALAVGQSVTLTYSVTLKEGGDLNVKNVAFVGDPTIPGGATPDCLVGSTQVACVAFDLPLLVTSKSVSASDDPVDEGTVLTYTLTFENQGTAPAEVDHTDVLTDVLDDTTLTAVPEASDDALSVSAVEDAQFDITGELAPSQLVTVSYEVTVKAQRDRGNFTADNFLVKNGEDVPDVCAADDVNCTRTPLSNIVAGKSVAPESGTSVVAGQVLTYTLTFTNTGDAIGALDYTDDLAEVLDDADITSAPVSSLPGITVTGGEVGSTDTEFRVNGLLAAGETVTVTYQVTVKADGERGDSALDNAIVKTGTDYCTPAVGSACTTSNPVSQIIDSKSVDPVSGTPVVAGQELTYTLTFENIGTGAGTVDKVDNLVHVLDDAEIVSEPVSSSPDLVASRDGDTISIGGSLAAGQTETVTYIVKVKPETDRGDDVLANFLLAPGGDVPGEPVCATDSEDCTVNPVGNIKPSKSVTPDSGSKVKAGDELTYTLSFENTGKGEAALEYTDYLEGVLDDADLVGDVTSSESLTVVDGAKDTLVVTGSLEPGETATVVYTVKVKPYAEQGDRSLANFLVVTGSGFDGGDCVVTNPLCTENPIDPPVPAVTPTPSATPGGPVDPFESVPPNDLAYTGSNVTMLGFAGVLVLLLGGGALLIGASRKKAQQD